MKEGDIVVCDWRSCGKGMFNEKHWFLHFITLSSYISLQIVDIFVSHSYRNKLFNNTILNEDN